jgi:hypothetical protein
MLAEEIVGTRESPRSLVVLRMTGLIDIISWCWIAGKAKSWKATTACSKNLAKSHHGVAS